MVRTLSPPPHATLSHAPHLCPHIPCGGGAIVATRNCVYALLKKKTHPLPPIHKHTTFQQAVSKRVQNAKVAKFSKNIHKRGLVPAGEVSGCGEGVCERPRARGPSFWRALKLTFALSSHTHASQKKKEAGSRVGPILVGFFVFVVVGSGEWERIGMEPGREGGTQKSSCFFQNITLTRPRQPSSPFTLHPISFRSAAPDPAHRDLGQPLLRDRVEFSAN